MYPLGLRIYSTETSSLTLPDLTSEIVSKPWGGRGADSANPHPLHINKGLCNKVILKPIKVMITCKNVGPYLNKHDTVAGGSGHTVFWAER